LNGRTSGYEKLNQKATSRLSGVAVRGVEAMDNSCRLLDLTAYGRQELWEDSPTGWPKRAKGTHPYRTDGPGTESTRISRPIAQ